MATRADELIELAAQAMERGESPFDRSFLVEHRVTLDEVYDLSDALAIGARMLLEAKDQLQSGSALAKSVGGHRLVDAILRGTPL